MEYFLTTQLLAILGLLVLLVHFYFQRLFKPNNSELEGKSSVRPPEPHGALPIIGHLHLLSSQTPLGRILGALADQHGPIFTLRLGFRRAVVVSSWELVRDCFTTNDTVFATRLFTAASKYIGYDQAVFALAPYGPYWRDVRKIVSLELLAGHRLEKLKHVRETEVDLCIKDLYALCMKEGDVTTQVTISKWIEQLAFNIIGGMVAGKRFSAAICTASSPGEDAFKEAIKKALYLSGIFLVSDAIPYLEWMDFGGYLRSMKQISKEIDAVLGKWLELHIQRRMEKGGENSTSGEADFIDVMLSVLSEDTIMYGHKRDTIIKATILMLTMASTETITDILTWAISLILNNKHVLKAVQEELDIQVGTDKLVQESDIRNLKYLQAIVKETLRLYPPGPLGGPREAMEDCTVGGYHVKKGTGLIVNVWKLHRDSRIWSNPNEFRPERFLTGHADAGFKGQQFEYIPFSIGRRMCPGGGLGLQVVHLTLARLLHEFDLKTPMDVPVDMTEGLGLALPKKHPVEVVIKPRLPKKVYHDL